MRMGLEDAAFLHRDKATASDQRVAGEFMFDSGLRAMY